MKLLKILFAPIKFIIKILFKFTPLGCIFKLAVLGVIVWLLLRFVIL